MKLIEMKKILKHGKTKLKNFCSQNVTGHAANEIQ